MIVVLFVLIFFNIDIFASSFYKALENQEVVKNKIYPSKNRWDFNIINYGSILNQAFIETQNFSGEISYFLNESWGIGVEGSYFLNNDKVERKCLETFFNKTNNTKGLDSYCAYDYYASKRQKLPNQTDIDLENKKASYGPVYMPIREIDWLFGAKITWNIMYGKQIIFRSFTGYLDVFLTFGAGVIISKFYPKKDVLDNGNTSRKLKGQESESVGAGEYEKVNQKLLYGVEGRPKPIETPNPFIKIGIGHKYHFLRNMSFEIEFNLLNIPVISPEFNIESSFILNTGINIRI